MGEESPAAGGGAAAAAAGKPSGTALPRRGKSCKGCLYYSSMLRSRGFNPVCVGIPRSIPQGKTKRTLISPPPPPPKSQRAIDRRAGFQSIGKNCLYRFLVVRVQIDRRISRNCCCLVRCSSPKLRGGRAQRRGGGAGA